MRTHTSCNSIASRSRYLGLVLAVATLLASHSPAWTLVEYLGPFPRSHGLTSPANSYSLTDNAGHLRYRLHAMTHPDGFINDYTTTVRRHSCCNHDFGLELQRPIAGDRWTFETHVRYFTPFANGRQLETRLYFGDGDPGTFFVVLYRDRDVSRNRLEIRLVEKNGPDLWDRAELERVVLTPMDELYFQVERDRGVLSTSWSTDGVNWTPAFAHDLGSALDGLAQTLVLAGASWFVPAGSFADYDYVSLQRNVVDVVIDVKPGSDDNPINPRGRGLVPVAILSTSVVTGDDADFDATTVDPWTVAFGPAGAPIEHIGGHIEDVDEDGDLDLLLHFRIQNTGIVCGDESAELTAETLAGDLLIGSDSITTTGCK